MGNVDWFVVGFLLVALGERTYERHFSHQAVRGQRKMEWSYTVLHSLHLLIYAATAAEYFILRRQIQWPVTAVALLFFVASAVIRVVAIRTLGKFWSLHLEIRREHQLVTHGIYRYVRHPAYVAIALEVASVPLVANAFCTLVLAVSAYVPLLLMRWRREEQEMTAKFGEQYVRYCGEVPAFVPWRWVVRAGKEKCAGCEATHRSDREVTKTHHE